MRKINEQIKSIFEKKTESINKFLALGLKMITITLTIIGAVAGAIAIIEYVEDKCEPRDLEPKAYIHDNTIGIEYWAESAGESVMRKLEGANGTMWYGIEGEPVIPVSIKNRCKEEIILTKVIIDIRDMEIYNNLNLSACIVADDGDAYLLIDNNGWRDVKNLTVSFVGQGTKLHYLLPLERPTVTVPLIEGHTQERVLLWKKEDLRVFRYNLDFQISAKCINDAGEEVAIFSDMGVSIRDNQFVSPIKKALSISPHVYDYNIEIDPNKRKAEYEQEAFEPIESEKQLQLPIYICPDGPCTFRFRIRFEAETSSNQKYTVSTYFKKIAFKESLMDKQLKMVYPFSENKKINGKINIYTYKRKRPFGAGCRFLP